MWKWLISIIDSTGFQTSVILFVGLFAFWQYRRNNKDRVEKAASKVLIEIDRADKQIALVKSALIKDENSLSLGLDSFIMPSNSWKEVCDILQDFLDTEEWNTLDEYYKKISLIDDAIRYNDNVTRSNIEQIQINEKRELYELINKKIDEAKTNNNRDIDEAKTNNNCDIDADSINMAIDREFTQFNKIFESKGLYIPKRTYSELTLYTDTIPNVNNSSITSKLKILSKRGKIGFLYKRIIGIDHK